MAYSHRDVLFSGNLRKIKITGSQLTFDNDAPIDLGQIGLMPRLGIDQAVCKLANDIGILIRRDGSKVVLGPTLGNWGIAVSPVSNEIFLQDSFINVDGIFFTDLKVFDSNGIYLRPHRALYSSVGIRYIDFANNPVMVTELSYSTIAGVEKCVLPITTNGATIAQCDKYTNSGAFLLKPDGTKLFYNHYIDRYTFVASDGINTWAALQGIDTPEPDDLSGWVNDAPNPIPGYNPKNDLVVLRAELDRIISKL